VFHLWVRFSRRLREYVKLTCEACRQTVRSAPQNLLLMSAESGATSSGRELVARLFVNTPGDRAVVLLSA
jgi:hypothetical protein